MLPYYSLLIASCLDNLDLMGHTAEGILVQYPAQSPLLHLQTLKSQSCLACLGRSRKSANPPATQVLPRLTESIDICLHHPHHPRISLRLRYLQPELGTQPL
jgi:hypothetical protein